MPQLAYAAVHNNKIWHILRYVWLWEILNQFPYPDDILSLIGAVNPIIFENKHFIIFSEIIAMLAPRPEWFEFNSRGG